MNKRFDKTAGKDDVIVHIIYQDGQEKQVRCAPGGHVTVTLEGIARVVTHNG